MHRLEQRSDSAGGQAAAQVWLQESLNVSRETLERLETYSAILRKWAPRINLVGPSTLESLWTRHIVDSAQLMAIAGADAKNWVDFGSGAGLPGLIIGILHVDKGVGTSILVEPSSKRCAFLREAARATEARITIIEDKIETVAPQAVDIVTARAFASLDDLLGFAKPWLALGGRALFPKGQDVQRELAFASTNWSFRHRINSSLTDPRGCIVEVEGLSDVTRP